MKRIAKIMRPLVSYGDRTGGAYHAISNQIWLWNIALTLAMIPLIGSLFILYGHLIGTHRVAYLLRYISVPVGIATMQAGLFWWGNGLSRRRTLALHLLIFSDCVMIWLFSLLIGTEGNIHFVFLAMLALPFYFFRREIQLRAWLIKSIWLGVIAAQLASAILWLPGVVPWCPLPIGVAQVVQIIIGVLAALIAVIWAVYFWWQLDVTARVLALWQQVRMRGVNLFPENANPLVIRDKIQQSTMLAVFTGVALGILLFQVGLCLHLAWEQNDSHLALRYFTVHGLPTILTLIFSVLAIYAQGRTKSDLPVISEFSLGPLFILVIGIINSKGSLVYVAHCAILPFPILLFYRDKKKFIAATLTLLICMAMLMNIVFLQRYGPIYPFPAKYDLVISAYVLLGTVFYLTTIILYMKAQTNTADKLIQAQKDKTESLLLNILPEDVADELKSKGFSAPREFESTTVLFTDFVGFTRIAESLSAVALVRELDQCFSYFDNVAQKYGLEKLKTIGDAYMAVGGIPSENNTHPVDCALAALEIQSFMNQMKDIKEQQGFPYWELRLGMHSGPLVAGVVGEKKFAYDVWGDTVNTASRMESSGEPGAINISRELYDRLRFLFVCEYRGKVYAKNKGEIEMYFLRGIKAKFSIAGAGRVPNADFKAIFEKIKAGAKLVSKRPTTNRKKA